MGDQHHDCKHDALKTLTGSTGHIHDLELEYVHGLIVSLTKPGTIADSWFAYWDEQLIGAGAFSDRAMEWLDGLGYTAGTVTDRWYAYWCDLAAAAIPATALVTDGDVPIVDNIERYILGE